MIEITQLRTQLGQSIIHDHLDLTVQAGEIIALIGDSGSGKSTLLREIILLEKPISGSIKIAGREILNSNEQQALWLRRRCGMMFQQGALFSSLTVIENIALPLQEHTNLSQSFIREVAYFKLALVGLSLDAGNKYPAQLSGGMIKRVAVARALALEPDILLLDEPTSGLDPINAGQFDELVLQLKKLLGLTIIIVTHDLNLLQTVADRVAVLSNQRIYAIAPLAELLHLEHNWLKKYFSGQRGQFIMATT